MTITKRMGYLLALLMVGCTTTNYPSYYTTETLREPVIVLPGMSRGGGYANSYYGTPMYPRGYAPYYGGRYGYRNYGRRY